MLSAYKYAQERKRTNVSSASGISLIIHLHTFGIEMAKKTVLFKTEVETHHKLSEKDVAVYDDSGKQSRI